MPWGADDALERHQLLAGINQNAKHLGGLREDNQGGLDVEVNLHGSTSFLAQGQRIINGRPTSWFLTLYQRYSVIATIFKIRLL